MSKPMRDQVIVITGASSGIGRETALMCADAGASVVLTARNEEALSEVAQTITASGGRALVVPADVTSPAEVERVGHITMDVLGRIDTWVNNAGVSLYATAEETTPEEAAQIMHTNFLGIVHGVRTALTWMRQQGYGTIINVGSVESQRALPLQAVYSASKHAVRAYTEALRMEQAAAKSGINVTLILPAGINTPLFNHARSRSGLKPMPVPPVYSPTLVARAIISAATNPQRDIYVGGASFMFSLLQRISPHLLDNLMILNRSMFRLQLTDQPDNGRDNLFTPVGGTGRVHGDYASLTKASMYTPVFELAPPWLRASAILLPITVILGLLVKARQ